MYLTAQQRLDPKFMAQNKEWLSAVLRAVRGGEAPTFVVSGPQEVTCRMRPKGAVEHVAMIGDEQFTINGVFRELHVLTGGEYIRVTMAPVVGKAPSNIIAATLNLNEAVNQFDGLETWLFDEKRWSTNVAGQKKAARAGENASLPSKEELRASEEWGGW